MMAGCQASQLELAILFPEPALPRSRLGAPTGSQIDAHLHISRAGLFAQPFFTGADLLAG